MACRKNEPLSVGRRFRKADRTHRYLDVAYCNMFDIPSSPFLSQATSEGGQSLMLAAYMRVGYVFIFVRCRTSSLSVNWA